MSPPPPPLPPLLLRKYCFLCAHWLYIFVVSLLFIAGTSNSSNTPSSLIFDSKDVLPFNSTSLTIINIPSFYTVLINKLSFIETTNHTSSSTNDGRIDHFLHDFASFVTDTSFYMQCITAHTSYYLNPKFNASQVEILQPFLSNNSKVCSSPNSIYKDLMPLDTYHYSYLVLGKSPTIMFSPVNMMEPLLVILKNSIVSKTSRLSAWNFAFHDTFAYESMYEKPSSFQYVKDIEKIDPNAREEMIEFLEQLIDNDLKTFERVYNIYLTYGIGLGFSAMNNNISNIVYLENSTASFCHPIFQNKTERSNYHEALHRIDAYLYYYVKFKNNADNNQSIFDNGSTDFSKYQFKSSFHDHMDMNVDFSFYYEATRRSVFKGKFNTYLSALFNASTIHSIQQIQIYNLTLKELYHLYNSLNSRHLVGVFQAMVHPACFTYYNDYGEIYRIIGDSLFEIVANDVVYFSMVVIGILIYLANIISYIFKSSLFIKKRIFLPLVGPLALILLSLCFTFAIRAKMGALGFWIQMVIVSGPAPLLIGSYWVSLCRFAYLKNQRFFKKKRKPSNSVASCKTPLILKSCFTSSCCSVLLSCVSTLILFLICLIPISASSIAFILASITTPHEVFIILFALEVGFMLLFAGMFFLFDLTTSGYRTIRQKGLSYYLFFDDPFYYRVDILLMSIMLLSVIPLCVGSFQDSFPFFLVRKVASVMYFICFYFVIGGTVTFAYWWNKLRGTKLYNYLCCSGSSTTASTPPQNDLELNLMDSSFREMFRAYSINEFSLENLLLYEEMEFLVRKGKCSEQEVEKIYSKYIESRSEHEVNLPSDVKKQYVALMNEFKQEDPALYRRQTLQQGDSKEMEVVVDMSVSSASDLSQTIATNSKRNGYISPSKLQDILMFEVVKNMSDTYSRLELTLEFKWVVPL
ncbi:hypothetical protein C9374_013995 [Naegleria lovaniensis]|uniref:RGS domain-containing protein n=1 Tax=Naegleria lovaniensis TaxID=51637 RepID=A0AA88GV06_NAELO|nr:uncharacterized protein C9374_013995 [Naegleria lovaniensis]KAG2389435.1 hypothetical protein C9374_013995 [Naegleria lovaniensis]